MTDQAKPTLSEFQEKLLAFEESWEGRTGSKTAAIRETFGWREVAYEMRLQQVLQDPAAEALHPLLVHRLVRVRAEKLERRRLHLVG